MLIELRVRDLGVISDLTIVLRPGMTALTGETGTGKTLVVEAIELLVGAKADPLLVRPGAGEAVVEGRFVDGDDEVVMARVVPSTGRSRAYIDGRMATAGALSEAGAALVDLHGQHAHQDLLSAAAQRAALDAFGGVDHGPRLAGRQRLAEIEKAMSDLGGDARTRSRELDLLRFQVGELDAAGLSDPGEEDALAGEEEALAGATAHREAAALASECLSGDDGAGDGLGRAVAAVAGRAPLAQLEERLRNLAAELAEVASDLRGAADSLDDDPERLAIVRARRQQLRQLCRKYGDDVPAVMAFAAETRKRLADLESWEERAAALESSRATAVDSVREVERVVGGSRRRAAPRLASAVQTRLRDLAMPGARFEVSVGDEGPGDDVTFLLGANPGEPLLPLARVASGGELARTMLAVRLTLGRSMYSEGSRTLVFDEVDAGVGGEAAVAVGRALAELATSGGHQVLVVTHLPQVAAFADQQVAVAKEERDGRTVATAATLDRAGRVVELSRMLSGQPGSTTARRHAEELLQAVKAQS